MNVLKKIIFVLLVLLVLLMSTLAGEVQKTGPVLYFFTFFDHPIVNGPSHPGTACLKNPALTGQKVESY
jgi:hypothetical protein